MKILFIQVHAGIGGATTSMYQLVRELNKNGFATEVLITGGHGPLVEWLQKEGIKVRLEKDLLSYGHGNGARTPFWSFPPFKPLTDLRKLPSSVRAYHQIIEELNVDLVYLNSSILWPAAIAAKRAGVKVVTHVREVWYHGTFGLRKRFFIRLTEKLSKTIIVLSEFSRSQFKEIKKVHLAYNAVDFNRYDFVEKEDKPSLKNKLGLNPTKSTVIMMGGALPHKGGQCFLEAASLIQKNRENVQFVVLGKVDPYYPADKISIKAIIRKLLIKDPGRDFQNTMKRLGAKDFVHLPGLVSNGPEWIKASDILVFPATTDHFGRPLIEAGYLETPVVASRTSTSAELVPNGKNGILFKPNSAKDLSKKISFLLDNPQKRKQMGLEGKRIALARYSLKNQVESITAMLNKIRMNA